MNSIIRLNVNELIVGYEPMAPAFKHLNQIVQTLNHLMPTVVTDNERHFKLRMLFKFIKLPWMEVGHEISVMAKHTANHPMVYPFRNIVQGQPEQRKSQPRSD